MIEFKKPLEIFRVNADATFELGKGVDPLVALEELSKAFMRQQSRIKRLEESGDLLSRMVCRQDGYGIYQDEEDAVNGWNKAKGDKL